MKFEVLHRDKKKKFIIAGGFVVFILVTLVIGISFARYRSTASVPIVDSEVNYSKADLNLVGVYLEKVDQAGVYDASDTVPSSGYTLNTSKSYCEVGGETDSSISITYTSGKLNFSGLTKRGTKCHAYFDVIRDTTKPTISSVTQTSVTKTSIAIRVNASDDEGVTGYYYSINNGSYTNSTSNTYTFNGLTQGTTYSIRVYVVDAAGNQSDVYTTSIKTEADSQTITQILAGYNKSIKSDFSTVYTTSTTNTVFTANDGDGTTYYFAGAPTDNYVYFAGFYWRIIRVNGDGSIRLIYQGTSATSTGSNAQMGTRP